ncbi:MAG: YbhB/YbcL family Raf kinase inhibitor-like protein [Steroidobacteraceae bacterium]
MRERLTSRIGRALRRVRAHESELIFHLATLEMVPAVITVTSPAFSDHGALPVRYTADGERLSPPLAWSGVPPAAASLVIIVEDADSPTSLPFVHAIVWALAGADGELPVGALPHPGDLLRNSTSMGRNSLLTVGYLAPEPPWGHGTHRYAFEVFALDSRPRLNSAVAAPGRGQVVEWLTRHAIAKGMLIGLYERP